MQGHPGQSRWNDQALPRYLSETAHAGRRFDPQFAGTGRLVVSRRPWPSEAFLRSFAVGPVSHFWQAPCPIFEVLQNQLVEKAPSTRVPPRSRCFSCFHIEASSSASRRSTDSMIIRFSRLEEKVLVHAARRRAAFHGREHQARIPALPFQACHLYRCCSSGSYPSSLMCFWGEAMCSFIAAARPRPSPRSRNGRKR